MRRSSGILIAVFLIAAVVETVAGQGRAAQKPAAPAATKPATAAAGPILVVETVKGTIEIETYPNDAPKTVEHFVALVKRNFYNGQRVHRVVPGFVVQFGDPQTRDMTKRDRWGSGGSGRNIGVAEVKRKHVIGAVAAAHPGEQCVYRGRCTVMAKDRGRLHNSEGSIVNAVLDFNNLPAVFDNVNEAGQGFQGGRGVRPFRINAIESL